jgi:GntR family transcriptional regulator
METGSEPGDGTMRANPPDPGGLPRAKGTSLHHQLFLELREEILRGDYAPGSPIPKEEDLGTRFGVSRITVRRAVADLETLGLVEKRQGRGTFVRAGIPAPRPPATLSLIQSLRQTVNETKAELLTFEQIIPPRTICQMLRIEQDSRATHVVRLRSAKETPVMVNEAWIPAIPGIRLTKSVLQKKLLYEILIEHGIVFGRVIQEFTAIAAGAAYARLLGIDAGVPLMKVERLFYGADGQPLQHLTVVASPERSRLLMDVSFEDMNTFCAGHIIHDKHQAP